MSINERIIRVANAAKVPPVTIKRQIYSSYGNAPCDEIKNLELLEKLYNIK